MPPKTILTLLIICLDGSIKSIDARSDDPLQQNMLIPQPPGTVVCLTEEQCKAKHASLGWTGDFYSDDNSSSKFPTKGCFSKKDNGRMYFGTGGSIDEMSNGDLPAILERVYCDSPPSIEQEVSPRPEGDERDGDNTVACLTYQQCKAKHEGMNSGGTFYMSDFPTKGCFSKTTNNHIYFGTGGTVETMTKDDLPGVQERVRCDAPTPEPPSDIACLTYQQCKAKHESMDNGGTFYMSDFPTKGCFSKTSNNNMYFGTGGTAEDMTNDDLPGVQERVRCNIPTVLEVVTTPSTPQPTEPDKPQPEDKPKPPVPVNEVEVISSQPLDDKEEEEVVITDEGRDDNSDESWNSLTPEVVITDEGRDNDPDEVWLSTPESKPCSSHNRRNCFYDDMCTWNGQECVEIDMTSDEEDIDMPINWDLVEEEEEEGTIEDNFAIWTGEEDSSLIDGIAGANDEDWDDNGDELWGLLDPSSETTGAKSHKSAKTSAPTTDMLESKSSKSKSAKSTSAPTTTQSPTTESPTDMLTSKSSKSKSAKSTSAPTTTFSPTTESPTDMLTSKSSKSKSAKSTSAPTTTQSPTTESPTDMLTSKSSKSKSAKSETTTTLATVGSTMMGISEAIDIDGTSDAEDSELDASGIAEMMGSGGSSKSSKATTTGATVTGSTTAAIAKTKSSKSKGCDETSTTTTSTVASTTSTTKSGKSKSKSAKSSVKCTETTSTLLPPSSTVAGSTSTSTPELCVCSSKSGKSKSSKSNGSTTTLPPFTGSTTTPVSKSSKSKSAKSQDSTTTVPTVTDATSTSAPELCECSQSNSAKTKSSKSNGSTTTATPFTGITTVPPSKSGKTSLFPKSAKSSAMMPPQSPPPVMPGTMPVEAMPDAAMPGGIAGGTMSEEPDMVESEEEYGTFRDSYLASASSGSANAGGEESSPSGVHLWAPIGVAVGLVALLTVMFAVKHRNKRYVDEEDGAFPCGSSIDDISPPIHAIPMWGSNLENGIEVSDDEDEPPLHGVLDSDTLSYENNEGEGITNVDTFPRDNISPTPEGLTVDQFMGDESFDNPESTLDVFVVTKDAGGNESVVTTSDNEGGDCAGIPFMNCV